MRGRRLVYDGRTADAADFECHVVVRDRFARCEYRECVASPEGASLFRRLADRKC
jgi:hypothetical protein